MITKEQLKKVLPDVLVVVLFALLAFAYFYPADIEGRILYRHDASAGRGAGQEQTEYLQRTGERTRWTNALFGVYRSSAGARHVSVGPALQRPRGVLSVAYPARAARQQSVGSRDCPPGQLCPT